MKGIRTRFQETPADENGKRGQERREAPQSVRSSQGCTLQTGEAHLEDKGSGAFVLSRPSVTGQGLTLGGLNSQARLALHVHRPQPEGRQTLTWNRCWLPGGKAPGSQRAQKC